LVYVTTTLPELEAVKTPVDPMLPAPVPFDVVQLPPAGVAVNVKLPSSHTSVTVEVIDGAAVTVNVTVSSHPLVFVKVISVVPAAPGVTSPEALIVATDVVLEFQPFVPNAVPLAERVTDDPPAVAVNVPDIVGFE
jgi:hypothetical protein